jgi:hypothetical protein
VNAATRLAAVTLVDDAYTGHACVVAAFTRKQSSSQALSECRASPAMPTQLPG